VREAAEYSLLQLHQEVQEEREQYLAADGEKQRQLEARDRELVELRRNQTAQESAHELELKALRDRVELQITELEQRLVSRDTELQEVRAAADHSLLQLHQVQEELEHYFFADGAKQRQLETKEREMEELRLNQAAQESAYELQLKVFRERLELQITELEQRLLSRDTELREVREAAEYSLLQLHQQVQEEREQYLAADGAKQRKLAIQDREMEELRLNQTAQESAHELQLKVFRDCFELQIIELEQRLVNRESELRLASEATELSMLQLYQAQEELEGYFLKARASDQLAQAQLEQMQRARRLMVRLQPDVLPTSPCSPSLAVQVFPDVAAATLKPSLQTEALLSTYAASLQRASALLERARRH
jgi:hypothetical protein